MQKKLRIISSVLLLLVFIMFPLMNALNADPVVLHEAADRLIRVDEDFEDLRVSREETDSYAGVRYIYAFPCPAMRERNEMLSVFFTHQYGEIRIDGFTVFKKTETERFHIGSTPGCYFAQIQLRAEDAGREIRVISEPAYADNRNSRPEILIASPDRLIAHYISGVSVELVCNILCIIIGMVFALISLMMRDSMQKQERMSMLYLGLFTLVFGLSRFADQPITAMVVSNRVAAGNTRLLTYITHTSFMICSFLACMYFYWSQDQKEVFLWMSSVEMLISISFAVLQLLGLRDFRENLLFMTMDYAFCISVILVFAVLDLTEDWKKKEWTARQFMFMAIVIGGIADITLYLVNERQQVTNYAMIMLSLYCIASGSGEVSKAIRRRERLYEAENALAEQRKATMMSQIQPHFIYNTMNTIYGLCDVDVEEAKRAIHDFSGYLRKNFESLEKKAPVPFEQELEHVRFYLSIQQARFGEDLQVEYRIGFTDFRVPALSVQPLVENAVKHGIRSREGKGRVTISTRVTGNSCEVVVEDDGIGFDPEATLREEEKDTAGRIHVGIRNVKERVETMCSGKLKIESAPGKGTRAVISVPSLWARRDEFVTGGVAGMYPLQKTERKKIRP